MAVRVVSGDRCKGACEERDYLHVSTCKSPKDDTVTLATIQRYIDMGCEIEAMGTTWKVRTLIAGQPMSPEDARRFATRYAERKHIPLVVTDGE